MTKIGKIIERIPMCGCGDPDSALEELRSALRVLVFPEDKDYGSRSEAIKDYESRMPRGLAYMIWYMLDKYDLTEHGGAVPGWLTDDGKLILAFLEKDCSSEAWFKAEEDCLNG